MPLKDWLPDLKGTLNSFYEEKIKNSLESKNEEYKALFTKHLEKWAQTQQALLVIALGIFLLLLMAYFWPEPRNLFTNMNHLQQKTKWETLSFAAKYISVGVLLYVVVPFAVKSLKNSTKSKNI
jgi:uncharacterized membrane protein